jgi:hypothetical protein
MELANPKFGGWAITIDGLVAKPMKLDVRDIINMFHIGGWGCGGAGDGVVLCWSRPWSM